MTCGAYRPDHNGECLNCDEPLDAHLDDAERSELALLVAAIRDALADPMTAAAVDAVAATLPRDPARVERIRQLLHEKLEPRDENPSCARDKWKHAAQRRRTAAETRLASKDEELLKANEKVEALRDRAVELERENADLHHAFIQVCGDRDRYLARLNHLEGAIEKMVPLAKYEELEREVAGALFRVDFDCGCTMRLFFRQAPKVTLRDGYAENHPNCVLARMVFVAE